ncbi:hypothetical protein C7M84_009830 [Penaeus vannamei]|uniref:Uncharacterized protein n=1 Tax=Penaeus vannamei TaxID=6689 RepID=A0A3R7SRG5_PENVA|nr:hypothetical protein C7M84_009830 [Penaeus vannamei]
MRGCVGVWCVDAWSRQRIIHLFTLRLSLLRTHSPLSFSSLLLSVSPPSPIIFFSLSLPPLFRSSLFYLILSLVSHSPLSLLYSSPLPLPSPCFSLPVFTFFSLFSSVLPFSTSFSLSCRLLPPFFLPLILFPLLFSSLSFRYAPSLPSLIFSLLSSLPISFAFFLSFLRIFSPSLPPLSPPTPFLFLPLPSFPSSNLPSPVPSPAHSLLSFLPSPILFFSSFTSFLPLIRFPTLSFALSITPPLPFFPLSPSPSSRPSPILPLSPSFLRSPFLLVLPSCLPFSVLLSLLLSLTPLFFSLLLPPLFPLTPLPPPLPSFMFPLSLPPPPLLSPLPPPLSLSPPPSSFLLSPPSSISLSRNSLTITESLIHRFLAGSHRFFNALLITNASRSLKCEYLLISPSSSSLSTPFSLFFSLFSPSSLIFVSVNLSSLLIFLLLLLYFLPFSSFPFLFFPSPWPLSLSSSLRFPSSLLSLFFFLPPSFISLLFPSPPLALPFSPLSSPSMPSGLPLPPLLFLSTFPLLLIPHLLAP